MAWTYDVALPKDRVPYWPAACVRCRSSPVTTVRIRTHAIGWWTPLTLSFGSWFKADAPACAKCRWLLRRQRAIRLLVLGVCIMAAVLATVRLTGEAGGPLRHWLRIGVAVLLLLPVFIWHALSPLTFGLTAYSDTVIYEFRDRLYAERFAELNGATVKCNDAPAE